MSFGSLSREAKISLAKGAASVKTAIFGGEGGMLPEEKTNAYKYVFEYSTGRFGATEETMRQANGITIKIGQAAKAGMGGHLMGSKVTEEIARVRCVTQGQDCISPASHRDINSKDDLKERITWLKEITDGVPVGIKIAASHIEEDLEVAVYCQPDFITIDCRGGSTGAAPNHIKDNVCIPAPYAIDRAKKYFRKNKVEGISLIVTGGFRTSADIAKALALGADAVGVSTMPMIGIGCQQYRVCHKGTCPVGIATQDPKLRARFNIEKSTQMLTNLFQVYNHELEDFARILGKDDIHELDVDDLITLSREISEYTNIRHA
jgi:glutamate synthase domain-containing protein 2